MGPIIRAVGAILTDVRNIWLYQSMWHESTRDRRIQGLAVAIKAYIGAYEIQNESSSHPSGTQYMLMAV